MSESPPDRLQSRLPGSPRLAGITDDRGQRWLDHRRALEPRYVAVWCFLVLCLAMVLAALVVATLGPWWGGTAAGIAIVPVAAAWTGFWLHALMTLGHEAAHDNLAPSRATNERLADWLIWPFFAQTTKAYRRSHWLHHTHLGDHEDTEVSYQHCLSPWFLTQVVTGIHPGRVLVRYMRVRAVGGSARQVESEAAVASDVPGRLVGPIRTFVLNVAIVASLLLLGAPAAALTWALAVLFAFPLFATVRQTLEHRRLDAPCDIDFAAIEHGPVNRMFGTGLFSRVFGAAGFNRHLLHHWDPGLSYTRFDDMEAFLRNSPLADEVDAARTTYGNAFGQAWRAARG